MAEEILSQAWFRRSPQVVAEELIGKRLVRLVDDMRLSGIVVETEAYLANGDPAAHSARGETRSNQSMFRNGGIAYVYPIHAKFCFNVVTEFEGVGSAVLVRAVKPECGLALMLERRNVDRPQDVANGPAKLCQAMRIDRNQDGLALIESNQLWIEEVSPSRETSFGIKKTARIGVTSAKHRELRFVLRDSPFASGPKRLR